MSRPLCPHARRLAEAVIRACERLPTLHVAQIFGLRWDIVRLLERCALQTALSALLKAQPRRLVMDEFGSFKGHRYASVVLDADARRVLWKAAAGQRSVFFSKSWDQKDVPKLKR